MYFSVNVLIYIINKYLIIYRTEITYNNNKETIENNIFFPKKFLNIKYFRNYVQQIYIRL